MTTARKLSPAGSARIQHPLDGKSRQRPVGSRAAGVAIEGPAPTSGLCLRSRRDAVFREIQSMSPQQLPAAECRALPVSFRGVQSRLWNGLAIQRRVDDGFVNATRMCKANGKQFFHYTANDRTRAYVDALAGSLGIPSDLITRQVMNGPNHLRGTWVHPRLAIDLARWISPQFAVWMDTWFIESFTTPPTPLPTPRRRRPITLPPVAAPPPAKGVLADCSQAVWDAAPPAERICHGLLYLARRIDTYDPLHKAFSRQLMDNMIRHFEGLMDIKATIDPEVDRFATARARSVARVLIQELSQLRR